MTFSFPPGDQLFRLGWLRRKPFAVYQNRNLAPFHAKFSRVCFQAMMHSSGAVVLHLDDFRAQMSGAKPGLERSRSAVDPLDDLLR
jgi:hypothetical protein